MQRNTIPQRDFEDAYVNINGIGVEPAKLERLKRQLRMENLDTEMSNYNQLGQFSERRGVLWECSRLKKNLKAGIIQKPLNIPGKCKCGQEIIYHCLIQHIYDKYFVIIGRCCYVGITVEEQRKEMCSVEGCNQRHRNRKYTVCNEHKKSLISSEQKGKRKAVKEQRSKEDKALKREQKVKLLGDSVFRFGNKYRETKIKDIPKSYVEWIIKERIDKPQTRKLLAYHAVYKE